MGRPSCNSTGPRCPGTLRSIFANGAARLGQVRIIRALALWRSPRGTEINVGDMLDGRLLAGPNVQRVGVDGTSMTRLRGRRQRPRSSDGIPRHQHRS